MVLLAGKTMMRSVFKWSLWNRGQPISASQSISSKTRVRSNKSHPRTFSEAEPIFSRMWRKCSFASRVTISFRLRIALCRKGMRDSSTSSSTCAATNSEILLLVGSCPRCLLLPVNWAQCHLGMPYMYAWRAFALPFVMSVVIAMRVEVSKLTYSILLSRKGKWYLDTKY